MMEWQGNPTTTLNPFTYLNLTEDWFCPTCKEGVWIQITKEEITGFLELNLSSQEVLKYQKVKP